jgi:putative colanic acid biosynthesis acetyltransferase WcaF
MGNPSRIYVDAPVPGKKKRLIWAVVYWSLFKHTPRFFLGAWRLSLLRLFGAKIGSGCKVAPSCFVWAPWNLEMGNYACLGDGVDCYNVDKIVLGDYSTVSQRAFLCSASHDISKIERPLFHKPIRIDTHAWVCAEAFVGPGVTVGEGAVVGARAVVMKPVEPWAVMVGNPAVKLKSREIR